MDTNQPARGISDSRARSTGAARTRGSTFARRCAALALGLLLAPVALELGLRIAALFVTGHRRVESSAQVICQGDSNTYGLHLPGEQAYPGQLDALLRGAIGEAQPIVANLGVPGKTSWVVAEELREDLERYAPAAVVVLAGVNDFSDRRPAGRVSNTLDRLRTVKMVRRLVARWKAATAEQPEAEPEPDPEGGLEAEPAPTVRQMRGPQEGHVESHADGVRELHILDRTGRARPFKKFYEAPDPERVAIELREELIGIVELVRAHGARPILLSYPSDTGRLLLPRNAAREAAEATGARLVDPLPAFEEAGRVVDRSRLLFKDKHATALGYSIFARLVANALHEEGVIELATPFDPLEEVRTFVPPAFEVELWLEEGACVGLRARYLPGHRVQFVLSGARGATPVEWRGMLWPVEAAPAEGSVLPLELDKLARLCLRRAGHFLVKTDEQGVAEVRLGESTLEFASDLVELWGTAVLIAPGQQVLAVSDAVRAR